MLRHKRQREPDRRVGDADDTFLWCPKARREPQLERSSERAKIAVDPRSIDLAHIWRDTLRDRKLWSHYRDSLQRSVPLLLARIYSIISRYLIMLCSYFQRNQRVDGSGCRTSRFETFE